MNLNHFATATLAFVLLMGAPSAAAGDPTASAGVPVGVEVGIYLDLGNETGGPPDLPSLEDIMECMGGGFREDTDAQPGDLNLYGTQQGTGGRGIGIELGFYGPSELQSEGNPYTYGYYYLGYTPDAGCGA